MKLGNIIPWAVNGISDAARCNEIIFSLNDYLVRESFEGINYVYLSCDDHEGRYYPLVTGDTVCWKLSFETSLFSPCIVLFILFYFLAFANYNTC